MCGLIGIAIKSNSGLTFTEKEALTELLYMDALRGMDSTGVCAVFNDATVKIAKKATWAPSFICAKAFTEIEGELVTSGKFIMGHNRKATVGNVTSKNAHPFVVKNEFVLMHNGSLHTHKHLGEHEVDSEAIAHYLHENWKDDDTPEQKAKVLQHIGGAYALVWYDLRTEKLNIVRNSQRPLYYATSFDSVIWCSDENMLKCALDRNNLKQFAIKSLPPFTLLTHDGKGLLEVALPPIPFSSKVEPTTTVILTPTGGKKNITDAKIPGSMSKNMFKRFLQTVMNKPIHFCIEDFVDISGKNSWYGEKLEWEFSHELTGMCPDEVMFDVMNNYNLAVGIVRGGVYLKHSGHVRLHIELTGASKSETTLCH